MHIQVYETLSNVDGTMVIWCLEPWRKLESVEPWSSSVGTMNNVGGIMNDACGTMNKVAQTMKMLVEPWVMNMEPWAKLLEPWTFGSGTYNIILIK